MINWIVILAAIAGVDAQLARSPLAAQSSCPCRDTPLHRDVETCGAETIPEHYFGTDHLAGFVYGYGLQLPERINQAAVCYYLFGIFTIPASLSGNLFTETNAAATSPWAENEANHIQYYSSATISMDGRYIIPYCFGMTSLPIYEIVALPFQFRVAKVLSIPDGVEAVRFFPSHLVVITRQQIIVFSMARGSRFIQTSAFSFPHSLYRVFYQFPDEQSPIWMRNMVMDNDFLYLLNAPGNGYGPILTFQIQNGEIALVDDGLTLIIPDDNYAFVFRNNLQFFEAYGKKYLAYHQDACRNYYGPGGTHILRLENNIPDEFLSPPGEGSSCKVWDRVIKDRFRSGFREDISGSCKAGVTYFTEEESFIDPGNLVDHNPIIAVGSYESPDTELWSYNGRAAGCSIDDLPIIEHSILPSGPVSGNFLVVGRASDSEGVRRVFAGYPLCVEMHRAGLFHQADGSVIFQAVIPEVDPMQCAASWTGCPNVGQTTYMPLAEDEDGDSNQSPDAPWTQDFYCIQFKPEPDPMPEGAVEVQPCSDAAILTFSGWAVDNSGIRQGWLLSEDAQVLVPLTVGLSRPDIGAQYPTLPGSATAGFSITYDASALPEGKYDFTVRLLAYDYQVLDFGPYAIVRDTSHPRPVSPPQGPVLLGPEVQPVR